MGKRKMNLTELADRIFERKWKDIEDKLYYVSAYDVDEVKKLVKKFVERADRLEEGQVESRDDYEALLRAVHAVVLERDFPEDVYREIHGHCKRTITPDAAFTVEELYSLVEVLSTGRPISEVKVDLSLVFRGGEFKPKPMADRDLAFKFTYDEEDFEKEMSARYEKEIRKYLESYQNWVKNAGSNEEIEEIIDEIRKLAFELDSVSGTYVKKIADTLELYYDEELSLEENKSNAVSIISEFKSADSFVNFIDREFPELFTEYAASFREDEIDYLRELLEKWERTNVLFCINDSIFVNDTETFFEYDLAYYVAKKLIEEYGAEGAYYDHRRNVLRVVGTRYGDFEIAPFDGILSLEDAERILESLDEEAFYSYGYSIGGKSYEAFRESLLSSSPDRLFSPEEVYAILLDYYLREDSNLLRLHERAGEHAAEVLERELSTENNTPEP